MKSIFLTSTQTIELYSPCLLFCDTEKGPYSIHSLKKHTQHPVLIIRTSFKVDFFLIASSSYGTMRENENTERNGKVFDQQLFILTAQCLALVAAFIFLKSLRGDIFLLLLLTTAWLSCFQVKKRNGFLNYVSMELI